MFLNLFGPGTPVQQENVWEPIKKLGSHSVLFSNPKVNPERLKPTQAQPSDEGPNPNPENARRI